MPTLEPIEVGSLTNPFNRRLRAIDAEFSSGYINKARIEQATITGGTIGDLSVTGTLTMATNAIFASAATGNHRIHIVNSGIYFYDDANTFRGSIRSDLTDDVLTVGTGSVTLQFGTPSSDKAQVNGDLWFPNASSQAYFEASTAETVATHGYIGSSYSGGTGNYFGMNAPYTTSMGYMAAGFIADTFRVTNGADVASGTTLLSINRVTGDATFVNEVQVSGGGTSGNPTITFVGDLDTGFYRSGVDACALTGGGTAYLGLWNTGVAATSGPYMYNLATTGSAANIYRNPATGQVLYSTSSRRYKDHINYDVSDLVDLQLKPNLHWRTDEKTWRLGFIAEDLAYEHPLLAVHNGEGEVESFDSNALLAVMAAKINKLEQEVAELRELIG